MNAPRLDLFEVRDMEVQHDIQGLIQALEHQQDENIRWCAVEALGEIGDESMLQVLVRALKKDESSYVRFTVAEVLGGTKDRRAVEPLIRALRDNDW